MMPKLIIWQCDCAACVQYPHAARRWRAGTDKAKPFANLTSFDRALNYFRTQWSA